MHGVMFLPQTMTYYWRVKATDGWDTVLSNKSRTIHLQHVVSVAPAENLPKESSLEQNFPNPFNPVTTIKYSIPKSGYVKLLVYNLLGQVITVLREGVQAAGRYEVEFNSATVPSGIYFYRIESPGFVATRKMVIAK